MVKYSHRTYARIAAADMSKIGVQLGAACVDTEIPVQVVAKWMGVTRQGVYYWFFGETEVEPKKQDRAREIIRTLLRALDAGELPAPDLATALQVVKKYRSQK